jgi:DNA-binding NtrC family response regulator
MLSFYLKNGVLSTPAGKSHLDYSTVRVTANNKMAFVLIATSSQSLHRKTTQDLSSAGVEVRSAANWSGTIIGLSSEECGVLLIDNEMPGLNSQLLIEVAKSLAHSPEIRSIGNDSLANGDDLHQIKRAPNGAQGLCRLVLRRIDKGLKKQALEDLKLMGLGESPFERISRLAQQTLPIRIEGERGTNKEGLARTIHALMHKSKPFIKVGPAQTIDLDNNPGTIFIKEVNDWSDDQITSLASSAISAKWRVIAGSRSVHHDSNSVIWAPIYIPPLRTRPDDLRALTLMYVNRYRRRLGLPRRRVHRSLWALILSYRWLGNSRELEHFVVQVVTSAEGATLSADSLTPPVRRLVEPDSAAEDLAVGFEEVVESRLRDMVNNFKPDSGLGLHKLTTNATERALIKLALVKTGGDQKAAAQMLGIARNTLRSKIVSLDIKTSKRR